MILEEFLRHTCVKGEKRNFKKQCAVNLQTCEGHTIMPVLYAYYIT